MTIETQNLHASAIAIAGKAVIIRGASGAGKSDMVLRCLAQAPTPLLPVAARLVADDRVILTRDGASLTVAAPQPLFGKLEVRGVGIITVEADVAAEVVLICDITAKPSIERLPETTKTTEVLGLSVPLIQVSALESSAPIKVLTALSAHTNLLRLD